MPRNSSVSGSAHAHVPNQFSTVQPEPPPAPAPAAPPPSRGSSSAPPQGGRQHAARLQKQMRAANAAEAVQLGARFAGYCRTMAAVEETFSKFLHAAKADLNAYDAFHARAAAETDPRRRAVMTNLADTKLDSAIKLYGDAASAWDVRNDDGKTLHECASADVKKIESAPNKNSLYTLDLHLRDCVKEVKEGLSSIKRDQIAALSLANESMARGAERTHNRLANDYHGAVAAFRAPQQSSTARADLEKVLDDLDVAAETMAQCRERDTKLVAPCAELLADPTLRDPAVIADVKKFLQASLHNNYANSLHIADNTECRIRILMTLTQHDNVGQPGRPQLEQWFHSMTDAAVAYHTAVAVALRVMDDEKKDSKPGARLPQQVLEARKKAAIDGQDQFGKVMRTYKKRAAEYAGLSGIVNNERLAALVAAMPEHVAETMRARQYNAALAAGQRDAVEAARFTATPYVPPAGTPELLETREGMVVGSVNQAGGLDGLDENGNVIASYFKDEDGGGWLRDYGDEPAPATGSLLAQARNIVARAGRTGDKIQAELAANGDCDERVDLLLHAFARTAREVTAMAGVLAKLPAGGEEAAQAKGLMTGLRADKTRLDRQLREAQQAQNFHSHKTRDPNGTSFLHLLKEGQVASVSRDFSRRLNRKDAGDWLDRYTISFKDGQTLDAPDGPKAEKYDGWVVHAHYNAADAPRPAKVHMKYEKEKDWGKERKPYHSPELDPAVFDRITTLAPRR